MSNYVICTFTLKEEQDRMIRELAEKDDRSASSIVRFAIEEYYNKRMKE